MLANILVNSLLQIALFTLIPLVWWLITARKKQGFFEWLGLKKFQGNRAFFRAFLLTAFGFLALSIAILYAMRNIETATSQFRGLGVSALPAAIVYSFLNTALSEEILFRGFLLKRLANRFGFPIGNAVQSTLFGLLHGALFVGAVGAFWSFAIVVFTGLIGWYMGYINEKKAEGSILPSWGIHGLANLFSSAIALFALL